MRGTPAFIILVALLYETTQTSFIFLTLSGTNSISSFLLNIPLMIRKPWQTSTIAASLEQTSTNMPVLKQNVVEERCFSVPSSQFSSCFSLFSLISSLYDLKIACQCQFFTFLKQLNISEQYTVCFVRMRSWSKAKKSCKNHSYLLKNKLELRLKSALFSSCCFQFSRVICFVFPRDRMQTEFSHDLCKQVSCQCWQTARGSSSLN